MEFQAWPKIPRLVNEKYHFTEKIDGTNACIHIQDGEIGCQSRSRVITPEDDNYGFARWVRDNKSELLKLVPGRYFGEWWGQGIQRGYGMDRKVFSLFYYPYEFETDVVRRVPKIEAANAEEAVAILKEQGSLAAPGWNRPEGVIQYNELSKSYYKIIMDK